MEIRSISVFYDSQGYPFKDQERTVRYPIFGNAFMGASNTTQIKFYVKEIGGAGATWVANGKLPNGVIGHQVLSGAYDTDLGNGEYYVTFTLSAFFTQYKGDVYISLAGYDGDLSYTEETDGVYTINGTPIIQTTGSIKLNIAYATGLVNGEEEDITFDNFFSLLNGKISKGAGIMVAPSYSNLLESVGNYNEGQLAYAEEENSFYILESGLWNLHYDLNEYRDKIGFFKRSASISVGGNPLSAAHLAEASKPYCFMIYAFPANDEIYIKTYDTSNLKFVKLDNEMTLSDSDKQYTQTYKSFTFNSSGVVTSVVNTTINGYTKSGADTLLATKLSKAGDIATGEIVFSNVAPKTTATVDNSSVDTTLVPKAYLISYLAPHIQDYNTLNNVVNAILGLIPTQASSSNKLVDENTMNSTINSSAAFFKGNYNTYADLMAVAWQTTDKNAPYYVTNNDYAYVNDDETHDDEAWRYIYVSGTGWQAQFRVNEAPLTADQLSALNSGITALLVAQITTNQNNIATLNSKLPKFKDFTITSDLWQLNTDTNRYYCEIDAGDDFVIDDNKMKIYTPISENDINLKDTYGINVSSNATTQKFTFVCTRDGSPSESTNYTIAMFGGN